MAFTITWENSEKILQEAPECATYGKWALGLDNHTGAYCWSHPAGMDLWATPYWESNSEDGINPSCPLQLSEYDGGGGLEWPLPLDLPPEGIEAARYVALIAPVLDLLETLATRRSMDEAEILALAESHVGEIEKVGRGEWRFHTANVGPDDPTIPANFVRGYSTTATTKKAAEGIRRQKALDIAAYILSRDRGFTYEERDAAAKTQLQMEGADPMELLKAITTRVALMRMDAMAGMAPVRRYA